MSDKRAKHAQTRAGQQRLARISHHFLSESQDIEPQTNDGKSPSMVLLIDDSQAPLFPILQLAAQLAMHGPECEVEQPGQPTINIRAHIPGAGSKDINRAVAQRPHMTVRIRSARTTEDIPPASSYTLLLPTEASPQGIRRSFLLLKDHRQRSIQPQAGIIMTGTDDPALARHYFSALQGACQRFLISNTDWRLYSYGLLNSQQPYPGLAGIARLLADDCNNHLYKHATNRQDKTGSDNSQPVRTSHDN